jgi:hypothetical protein
MYVCVCIYRTQIQNMILLNGWTSNQLVEQPLEIIYFICGPVIEHEQRAFS